ncbi:predicted protein [Chaetomium globosum CBS 148.51]|uniref:Uncharacterized protein n=1 Tax=Chaetomium globosum (strain ATCC 6205 / CBS 148.51 / DSM 1962 / NBRC 6347 / NRRL 1970) TaxID=306901 RepID=Q2HCH9_CHAGB|nr:uncharacterized protein CHGG_02075 [Chaetomium globosum CBS 148.51]EAQ93840.1 predicted protein [Chaetomium globosum CBS 148.51]
MQLHVSFVGVIATVLGITRGRLHPIRAIPTTMGELLTKRLRKTRRDGENNVSRHGGIPVVGQHDDVLDSWHLRSRLQQGDIG